MKVFIFAIVFISPPFLKKIVLRAFLGARFGRGSSIGWFSSVIGRHIEVGDYSTIKSFTLIRCDGEVKIGNYTEISSFSVMYGCGSFKVGNKCYVGPQTWINISEDVIIGNGVGIGPRTMIFTHGSFLPYTEGYPVGFGKVTIGNTVWFAAGVFVHPGVQVGDNVFVNSRSVLTKSIPSGQYVEGFPAKQIRPMDKIRRPITPDIRDDLILNILKHFISVLQQVNREIKVSYLQDQKIILRFRRRDYFITLVDSKGRSSLDYEKYRDKKIIVLLNNENWVPAKTDTNSLVFNFLTMMTPYSRDYVHKELYKFMKMYYGIIFDYE